MSKIATVLATLGLLVHGASGAPMRSRAEGVPGVRASNTVGLGDIWVTGGLNSHFRIRPVLSDRLAGIVDSVYRDDFRRLYGNGNRLERDLLMVPELGATIGLANFLHLELHNVPWDGEKLGASTARLKFTTPNNDNLRIFGLAFTLDATLSTEEDIYSRGETTPGFDPILFLGVMADVDVIKAVPGLPVKLYVNYENMDDYRLARAYTQHRLGFAADWKGPGRGYYARGAVMLYKPLPTPFNPHPADEYLRPIFELGLGLRATIGDRFTVVADFSLDPVQPLSFYDREAARPPRFQVGVEAPLVYQETRAEAIRALIYNEEMRKRVRRAAGQRPASAAKDTTAAGGAVSGLRLDDLSLEERKGATEAKDVLKDVFDDTEEKEVEKRKQIRTQLKQIEELLE